MKRILFTIISVLLLPTTVLSEDEKPPEEEKRYEISGYVTPGGQLTNDPASSKFNEYRDIVDGFYIPGLWVDGYDTKSKLFLEVRGTELFRDDIWLRTRVGKSGFWNIGFEWNEIPHLLSNKAKTPYNYQGGGIFNVTTTVPGLTEALVPTNPQLLANDNQVAAYLAQYIHPTRLENERKKGIATAQILVPKIEDLKILLEYSIENRDGNKITYGPIGDRPPRTLNIQFPEAIDYRINEFRVETDYIGEKFLVNLSYLLSDFEDKIDTQLWQNIFTDSTGTFDTWGGSTPRNVGTFGRRPLFPDNLLQNASITVGLDLPWESYLTATGSYIRSTQDVPLLPYSYNGTVDTVSASVDPTTGLAWDDVNKLPRRAADAEVNTWFYNVDYIINPIQHLNLKAFYRFYDPNNDTPTDRWRYVTQETTNTNGTVNYRNMRRNLEYTFDKQNAGLDARYNLNFWRSTFGLGYELEYIDRVFREADTAENIFKTSLRAQPADWWNFFVKYYYGDRDGRGYNGNAASSGYWYTPSMVSGDRDNPEFTFYNHPDMRRFDVSDRHSNQVDLYATAVAWENLDVGASYHFRNDNFDSNVLPAQPLLNITGESAPITAADRDAFTPGNQVGLLSMTYQEFGFDGSYPVSESLILTAFFSQEFGKRRQRGFEFQENNKENPSAVSSTAELGPWTRGTMQWMAKIKDQTTTVGLGADYVITPDKFTVSTNHVFSNGEVHIVYSGFGTQSSVNPSNTLADTFEFAFRTPPKVRHVRYTGIIGFEYQVLKNLITGLSFMFERYKVRDWQQEANMPWFESVGSENFLRDSSSATSTQWGNRLVNLGSYLAPSYYAYVGSLGVTYKF